MHQASVGVHSPMQSREECNKIWLHLYGALKVLPQTWWGGNCTCKRRKVSRGLCFYQFLPGYRHTEAVFSVPKPSQAFETVPRRQAFTILSRANAKKNPNKQKKTQQKNKRSSFWLTVKSMVLFWLSRKKEKVISISALIVDRMNPCVHLQRRSLGFILTPSLKGLLCLQLRIFGRPQIVITTFQHSRSRPN